MTGHPEEVGAAVEERVVSSPQKKHLLSSGSNNANEGAKTAGEPRPNVSSKQPSERASPGLTH